MYDHFTTLNSSREAEYIWFRVFLAIARKVSSHGSVALGDFIPEGKRMEELLVQLEESVMGAWIPHILLIPYNYIATTAMIEYITLRELHFLGISFGIILCVCPQALFVNSELMFLRQRSVSDGPFIREWIKSFSLFRYFPLKISWRIPKRKA